MIRMTNWVADIPEEDKHLAYMGENNTMRRQFLLTGEDAAAYAGWTFRLDMQFDVSTVTSAATKHTERVEEQINATITEASENKRVTTQRESGEVTQVTVDCENSTDIAYLTQEQNAQGLLLTWTVLAQHTRLPGRLWATLRAQNANGSVKKSALMLFLVDKAVVATAAATPALSEFEQMELAMDERLHTIEQQTALSQTAATVAAASREAAETSAAQAQTHRSAAADSAAVAEQAAEQAIEAADGVHKSAYDIAVDKGFEGTEEEWLASLKGEKGEAGATTEEIEAAAAVAGTAAVSANAAADSANAAAALANAAADGVVTVEQNAGQPLRFWVGTHSQYEALAEKDPNTAYFVSDDTTISRLESVSESLNDRTTNLEQRDYVVDQGSVGVFTYRKWESGLAECWCKLTLHFTSMSAYGPLWVADAYVQAEYPLTFTAEPVVVASPVYCGQCNGWLITQDFNSGRQSDMTRYTPPYQFVRQNDWTGGGVGYGEIDVHIRAVGRWKE